MVSSEAHPQVIPGAFRAASMIEGTADRGNRYKDCRVVASSASLFGLYSDEVFGVDNGPIKVFGYSSFACLS
jgi:hypothetical protein